MVIRQARPLCSVLVLLLMLTVTAGAQAQGKARGHDDVGKAEKAQPQGNAKARADKQPGKQQKADVAQGKQNRPDKAVAQQKGQGKAKAEDRGGKAGQAYRPDGSARQMPAAGMKGHGNFKRTFAANDVEPGMRHYARSQRMPERVAAGAVARAYARGLGSSDIVLVGSGNRVRLANKKGAVLVDLDEQRARNLGAWDVRPLDDRVREDAPSFCRSGAGHPVWGRQWCIDKGFGLGTYQDVRWGRTSLDNVTFTRPLDSGTLGRDALISLLGNVVFDRLGLHAVTLGYAEPLSGTWAGEPTGPRVLQLYSGNYPVAEIVDTNRDNRAETLVVALRPW